jgi:hypothetical protein
MGILAFGWKAPYRTTANGDMNRSMQIFRILSLPHSENSNFSEWGIIRPGPQGNIMQDKEMKARREVQTLVTEPHKRTKV